MNGEVKPPTDGVEAIAVGAPTEFKDDGSEVLMARGICAAAESSMWWNCGRICTIPVAGVRQSLSVSC